MKKIFFVLFSILFFFSFSFAATKYVDTQESELFIRKNNFYDSTGDVTELKIYFSGDITSAPVWSIYYNTGSYISVGSHPNQVSFSLNYDSGTQETEVFHTYSWDQTADFNKLYIEEDWFLANYWQSPIESLFVKIQNTFENNINSAFTFLTWILPYLVLFALLIVWINWGGAIFSAIQNIIWKITKK